MTTVSEADDLDPDTVLVAWGRRAVVDMDIRGFNEPEKD